MGSTSIYITVSNVSNSGKGGHGPPKTMKHRFKSLWLGFILKVIDSNGGKVQDYERR